MTIFLKFQSEAEAIENLADFRNEDGEWLTYNNGNNLHVVGTIYKPTGNMIAGGDGMEYPEMAPIEGFHVNFLGNLPAALEPFVVVPSSPDCVFG